MRYLRVFARFCCISGMLLTFILLATSCRQVDRIVIDGATAIRMENHVNEQLYDTEYGQRGNTCSNIRNGGYVLLDSDMLYFIHEMPFPDGSSLYYLQELPANQIGSLTARNEIIGSVHGRFLGKYDRFILYVAVDPDHTVMAFDLEQYTAIPMTDEKVASALLLEDALYLTALEHGTLRELRLGIDESGDLSTETRTIAEGVGTLIGLSDGHAFTLYDEQTIEQIELHSGAVIRRIVGGVYQDIQVSGSWILFREGDRLMRQAIDGGVPVEASIHAVEEYATCGHWLAFTAPDGGLFVSHLDGTGIAQISADRATGLQLMDNRVFYRNQYDGGTLYTIDLVEGIRSALLGESVTDGGLQIEQMAEVEERLFREAFEETVLAIQGESTSQEQYWSEIGDKVLFAEISNDDETITFHRRIGVQFSPEEVDALVTITYRNRLLGRYTDGGLAYRVDTVLTLFDPVELRPLVSRSVAGRPPSEIKSGEGDRYGLPVSWHQKAIELMESGLNSR